MRNRRRKFNLAMAAYFAHALPFRSIYFTPDPVGGGGAGDPSVKTPVEPKKIELTEDELNSRITAATKAEADRIAEERRKEKEKDDAAAAKEQGKWKDLAEKHEKTITEKDTDIARLKLNEKRTIVSDRIREYVGENHAEYLMTPDNKPANPTKYILPFVEFDAETKDDEIEKRVKTAVAQFVKDNPRTAPKTGAPSSQPSKTGTGTHQPPGDRPKINGRGIMNTPASRF